MLVIFWGVNIYLKPHISSMTLFSFFFGVLKMSAQIVSVLYIGGIIKILVLLKVSLKYLSLYSAL